MTMRKWFVIHDGKVVEEVFFLEGMKAEDVRRALIAKDGFPEDIAVFTDNRASLLVAGAYPHIFEMVARLRRTNTERQAIFELLARLAERDGYAISETGILLGPDGNPLEPVL